LNDLLDHVLDHIKALETFQVKLIVSTTLNQVTHWNRELTRVKRA